MSDIIEVICGIFLLAVMAMGGLVLVLVVQTWFWVTIIAVTLIVNLT
jgi:hypothetical protein